MTHGRRILLAALAGLRLAGPAHAADGAVVRAADLQVVFRSATECDLTLVYTIESSEDVTLDHRLLLYDGTHVGEARVTDARATSSPTAIGARSRCPWRSPAEPYGRTASPTA